MRSAARHLGLRLARRLDAALGALRRRCLPPQLLVFEDCTAPWLASALGTACELGLPERVPSRGSIALETLASLSRVDSALLLRLLRVLSSHGYFALEGEGAAVRHSRLSRGLMEGRGGHFCRLQAASWYRDCFAADRVERALRRGRTPLEDGAGRPFFELLGDHPERGRLFSQAMAEISRFCAPFLAPHITVEPGARVLDVGGGNGEFCRLLRRFHPGASFTILDLESHPADSELTFRQGSFFESLPAGYGHLLLKNVLHDWDDTRARRVLGNCRESVVEGARLTLVELVLPDAARAGSETAGGYAVDWNVYCTLGGKERTLEQYRGLLESTGWRFERLVPTATPLCLLEARAR